MSRTQLFLSVLTSMVAAGCGGLDPELELGGSRNSAGVVCAESELEVAGTCVPADASVELRLVRGDVRMFTAENGCWDLKWLDGPVNEDMEEQKQVSGFMPDPMVEAKLGQASKLSDMIDNTTHPSWNNELLITAPASAWVDAKLALAVYDAEFMGNKPNRILTGKQLMDSCMVTVTAETLAAGELTVAPCGERTGIYQPAVGTSEARVSLVKKIELRLAPAPEPTAE